MDRRQVLIGSGAVAVAGTASWSPEVSAQVVVKRRSRVASAATSSLLDGGVRGSHTLNASAITLTGTLVPA